MAYLFAYSMRNVRSCFIVYLLISFLSQKTHAYHRMTDTVPVHTKKRRLNELIDTFYSLANSKNQKLVGTEQLVLVETVSVLCVNFTCDIYMQVSKRNPNEFKGRTDGNIKAIVPSRFSNGQSLAAGDYVAVKVQQFYDNTIILLSLIRLCLRLLRK